MASKPLAILGMHHTCPGVGPGSSLHIGGPVITPGQSHVKFNGIPWAVEGGTSFCAGMPGPDQHVKGSSKVRINGKGVMRIGDSTAHGGKIATGIPLIMVC